ncbi:VQ motif-containing protein 17-like [Sesamum indicum]|uniref:VQ motif-containing protein 17-like n=1 Tax=Sesamum indicum TaxID=4182 RepID=A0A6I9TSX2_SESIN|nr:VQ motif-containing protein 17-like [Sesamum indicum]
MKPQSFHTTSAPPKLAVHNDSRIISKQKPKIRIIHIVAPEIIKTDVENFRELVQRLTGKPVERKDSTDNRNSSSSHCLPSKPCGSKARKNIEPEGVPVLQDTQRIKKEIEDICDGENPNAFLSFWGDVDGFFLDMNEFPLLSFRPSQFNTFGEMPLC